MTITKNDNHVQDALDTRIEFFKNKVRFGDLLTSFVGEVQEVEDALFQILDDTNLDTAQNQQLDDLGSIVGEARFGREDTLYRGAIATRIMLNKSGGTIEDIIGLIRGVAGDVQVNLREYSPAAFIAEIVDPIDPLLIDPNQIGIIVKSGKAGGVRGLTAFHVAGPFQFDSGLGYDLGAYGGAI